MKVVSYNIQFARGLDFKIDLDRVCDAIADADLVCLQEVDQFWQRSGNVDQFAEIQRRLPQFYSVFGSSFNLDASFRDGDGTIVNRRRRQGNMILSRWPIISTRCFNLPKIDSYQRFNMQMLFVESVVAVGDYCFRLYNYHGGYLASEERLAQVDYFASVFERSPGEGGAWSGKADIDGDDWSNASQPPLLPHSAIVCGDFNAPPASAEYRRLLDKTGLIDCWALADRHNIDASSLRKEVSADIDISGKVDHILLSADMVDFLSGVGIDQRAEGSDHKPVWAELDLPPGQSGA